MATARDRKVWSQILDLYRNEYPYLWDKSHSMYNNHAMREEAFNVLIQIYRDAFDEEATVPFLKKKIGNMRTIFFNELKKVKESIKSGADEVYQPTLWYYDQMNFLAKIYDPSVTNSNGYITIDPLNTENSMLDNRSENNESEEEIKKLPSQETKRNIRRPRFKRKHITVIKEQRLPINNSPRVFTTITEDWEVFGRSIGLQLRDISQEQLIIASKLISDTIYYAKLQKLSEDSRIKIDVTPPEYTIVGTKLDPYMQTRGSPQFE